MVKGLSSWLETNRRSLRRLLRSVTRSMVVRSMAGLMVRRARKRGSRGWSGHRWAFWSIKARPASGVSWVWVGRGVHFGGEPARRHSCQICLVLDKGRRFRIHGKTSREMRIHTWDENGRLGFIKPVVRAKGLEAGFAHNRVSSTETKIAARNFA